MSTRSEPRREWATLAVASLGAIVAGLVVLTTKDPAPWYLTVAIAAAVAVFVVSIGVLVAQPFRRNAHRGQPGRGAR